MTRDVAHESGQGLSEAAERIHRDDWFVVAAAKVGDLTSPFYEEERHRDVWNEASAVGLQLTLWLGTALATAMLWIGGAAALPYGLALVVLVNLVAGFTLLYASRLGVQVDETTSFSSRRMIPYYGLLVLLVAGAIRALVLGGAGASMAYGVGVGASVGFAAAVWGAVRSRRQHATV